MQLLSQLLMPGLWKPSTCSSAEDVFPSSFNPLVKKNPFQVYCSFSASTRTRQGHAAISMSSSVFPTITSSSHQSSLDLSMGFPGSSGGKESACNAGDTGSIPGSGRSPGGGNVNPFQFSCLENPMDRGAWWDHQCYSLRIKRI